MIIDIFIFFEFINFILSILHLLTFKTPGSKLLQGIKI